MAGLTFLFGRSVKSMLQKGQWDISGARDYLKDDAINSFTSSVKSAIVPVKKKSIKDEGSGQKSYVDSVDSLFLLSKGEVSSDYASMADAKIGLGPNKDQIYLAASAKGETAFRIAFYSNAFLRDTHNSIYTYYVYMNTGVIGTLWVEKDPRAVVPAFCL